MRRWLLGLSVVAIAAIATYEYLDFGGRHATAKSASETRTPVDERAVDAPATAATARVMSRLDHIDATLQSTRYAHRTRIDPRAGRFELDCSGLLNHVLRPAAPRAFRALARERPVARTYARTIAAAPTDRARRGWQRVARLEDVRPGDVFAFERQSWWPGPNTGHVGFFVSRPRPVTGADMLYVATIVDSTDLPHGVDDDRVLGGAGGYGHGEIALLTDADGAVIAIGWWGAMGPLIPIEVQLGRVTR